MFVFSIPVMCIMMSRAISASSDFMSTAGQDKLLSDPVRFLAAFAVHFPGTSNTCPSLSLVPCLPGLANDWETAADARKTSATFSESGFPSTCTLRRKPKMIWPRVKHQYGMGRFCAQACGPLRLRKHQHAVMSLPRDLMALFCFCTRGRFLLSCLCFVPSCGHQSSYVICQHLCRGWILLLLAGTCFPGLPASDAAAPLVLDLSPVCLGRPVQERVGSVELTS